MGLLPLALAYRFGTSPVPLLALQAAACAAAALPIEAVARRASGDRVVGLLAALAFLATPQLVLAEVFDFHTITVCALATALLVHGVACDRPASAWGGALLALSLREQMGLAVAGAALPWALLRPGRRRAALLLGVAGLAAFALLVLAVMPAYAGGASRYDGRYASIGGSAGGVLRFALQHPLQFLAFPVSRGREAYLLRLASGALPLLLVALASARTAWPLLPAAPLLALQLYADWRPHWHIYYQYGAAVVPCLAGAAALALGRLGAWRPGAARLAAAAWAGGTAMHLAVAAGPLLTWPGGPLDREFPGSPRAAALARAVALVPPGASVSAQNDVAPHLVGRPALHVWPDGEGEDGYLLLDVEGAANGIYRRNVELVAPAGEAAARARADPGFEVLVDEAGVLLARRR